MPAIYLEIGKTRVFAGAVDWPGWCRPGRNEGAAMQALLDSAPRYQRVVRPAGLAFVAPQNASAFHVVERLQGNATTDFGAPNVPLSGDRNPVAEPELLRWQSILRGCWAALDEAVAAAEGRELRKGPRGGGRELPQIVNHVLEAEAAYLAALGWKPARIPDGDWQQRLAATQQAILEGLAAAVRGEIPATGPRGGIRWAPRTFVRREAWHALDHAWEIEDRTV